ncbi:MAG TPA: PDZ domain-containing protein, partial [Pirellulaceae bacterium]|nr:PDZ domain-containing protein [Pirellulaceae bacterium]
ANMGGRIVALSVCPTDPSMFWVATASGGLLKTTNNGISFEHQFDRQSTVSIGAVAVAPSDSKIVWVGTGENNPRNSVSYGDGVYKSVDGGKSWKRMGLEKTYQIGHIVVHPTDPNIVYVGALGRLYGANPERGLYKTTNGGESWERVLFVDDKTGVIDFRLHPTQPDTLIVATWERLRDGFDSWPGRDVPIPDGYDGYDPIKKWGPGSGLWKTTDGGKSWKRLTAGLPTGQLGRIGLDWYVKDPNILYAVIDCENIGKGPEPIPVYIGVVGENSGGVPHAAIVMPDSPAAKAGIVAGDVFVSIGDMNLLDFDQLLEQLRRRRVGEKVAIKIKRGDEVKEVSVTLAGRPGQQQGGPGGPGGGGPATGVWFGFFTERRDDQFIVTRVMPDGPAAKAGVQDGDQLLAAAGKKLDDASSLTAAIANSKAGDKLKLTVKRGTEEKQLEVTLEERPPQARFAGGGGGGGGAGRRGGGNTAEGGASDVYLGIQGETAEGGVKLNEITDDGPADKAKLLAGDLVTEVDGRAITTYEALVEEIRRRRPGDVLRMTIRRDDQPQQIAVTVERRAGAARTRPYSPSLAGQSANVQDLQGAKGAEFGGIYKSVDGGETWRRVNSLNDRPMYFSQVRVDPNDEKKVYALGVAQFRSSDGGLTFSDDFGRSVHADGHALWIDPRDGRHMVMGVDGGVYTTYDRGSTWDHLNLTDIAQFYHVAITGKAPYQVVGGLQDNGSWLGPSLSQTAAGPINEDWVSVGGGDGFMCRVDAEDPDLIYFESQNGAMARRNLRTGEAASIRPRRVQGATNYRFNWNTPFILSNHNPRLFYAAGNFVFRSLNRGDDLHVISPEITLTKRGSATALAESPRDADVLYVGTDDGALWMTRDGGRKWTDITRNLGLPSPRWISTIEASRHSAGRVYVACDGHRADDDEPYLFVSEDYGQTWRSLRANLPIGSTRCLREDPISPNLLLLGTEFGAWCSVDRGQHWNRMSNTGKLPTVAVHEFAFHPASGEVAVATHGRSIWICDITVLRQVKAEHLANKPALYDPATVTRWQALPRRGGTNRRFIGANPENGAQLYYALPAPAKQSSLKIVDIEGKTVRELRAPLEAGLHKVGWDLSRAPEARPGQGGGAGGPGGGRGFGGRGGNPGGSPGGAAEKPG